MLSTELAALFARDIARLIQELQAFPDTASVWKTAPGVTNAAGTLALHLEGNLREYIGRQLGQIAFKRDRPLEFSARGVEQAELIKRLEAVKEMVPRVIAGLSEAQLDADSLSRARQAVTDAAVADSSQRPSQLPPRAGRLPEKNHDRKGCHRPRRVVECRSEACMCCRLLACAALVLSLVTPASAQLENVGQLSFPTSVARGARHFRGAWRS
jgi:hypothetical protein